MARAVAAGMLAVVVGAWALPSSRLLQLWRRTTAAPARALPPFRGVPEGAQRHSRPPAQGFWSRGVGPTTRHTTSQRVCGRSCTLGPTPLSIILQTWRRLAAARSCWRGVALQELRPEKRTMAGKAHHAIHPVARVFVAPPALRAEWGGVPLPGSHGSGHALSPRPTPRPRSAQPLRVEREQPASGPAARAEGWQ
jgi:hypothetical protein